LTFYIAAGLGSWSAILAICQGLLHNIRYTEEGSWKITTFLLVAFKFRVCVRMSGTHEHWTPSD